MTLGNFILLVLSFILLIPLLLLMISLLISTFTSNKFFCNVFGWHKAPKQIKNNGIISKGKCPVCGKQVMQDGQGNWF